MEAVRVAEAAAHADTDEGRRAFIFYFLWFAFSCLTRTLSISVIFFQAAATEAVRVAEAAAHADTDEGRRVADALFVALSELRAMLRDQAADSR